MPTIGLVLEPLDTLFFRDGRPFSPGLSGQSGLPTPQSFAGAMRTYLLRKEGADFRHMRGKPSLEAAFAAAGAAWLSVTRFRGPWPADISDAESPQPFVPAPADLVLTAGRPALLRPLRRPLPGWQPPAGEPQMLPLWLKGLKPDKRRLDWLTLDGLRVFLQGQAPGGERLRRSDDLYATEERTGIGVDEKRQTAAEGLIYSTRSLRLQRNIAFYGEVDLPGEHLTGC